MNLKKIILVIASFGYCNISLEASIFDALSGKSKVQIQFELSPKIRGQLKEMLLDSGDTINQNLDSFFRQINESLPKISPALEKLGASTSEAIKPTLSTLGKSLILNTLGVAGITLTTTIAGYAAQKYIRKYLFEPSLIERKSSRGFITTIRSWLSPKNVAEIKQHMVIDEHLEQTLTTIMNMAANTKKNGGQFENILLYGESGTGKTLFAELLAEYCGMDYAIIPAAKISAFFKENKAAEKLDELFSWAAHGKNGTILFFDEAETFLANRNTLSNEAQNALNEFLQKTGTPSDKIMIIAATNRPEILDSAVLDRFGSAVEFKLPDQNARIQQLKMHTEKIFGNHKGTPVNYDLLLNQEYIEAVAEKLAGCSGRTIQQCVNKMLQYALAQDTNIINNDIVDKALASTQAKLNMKHLNITSGTAT